MKLVANPCPVCGHTLAAPFFEGGDHPLATLGWPASEAEARAMPRLPHAFRQCPACTHVWNPAFDYDAVPYRDNRNRMFNAGAIWKGHLAATRDLAASVLPPSPTVVEVGCGEGHFLRGLAEALGGDGRFLGFDPNMDPGAGGLEFHGRLFEPLEDMAEYRPDAVIIRHVLEHLTNPAQLIEQLSWGAALGGKPCYLFAECPCIDRVFETRRLADFFYEHVAHFTTRSFRTLMERAGEVVELSHGYDREVVYGLVRLGPPAEHVAVARGAAAFAARAEESRSTIRAQLDEIAATGRSVAIWGGTGKAAAFMHQFGADADRFPLVVDSDLEKAGGFVPGTGQSIAFRDVLKGAPVDVLIIPTQWRAKDIAAEMAREGISADLVLIEHEGRLIDFHRDRHPYGPVTAPGVA